MREDGKVPGFLLFREPAIILSLSPDESAGRAIKAAVNYFLRGKEPAEALTETEAEVFEALRASIDRSIDAYWKKVEGGKKGANNRYGR